MRRLRSSLAAGSTWRGGRPTSVQGSAKPDGFLTTVRMPRGRAGMAEALAVHVPPQDQPGCRPLLEPRGVLLSTSFFLDVSKFWEERAKLFTPEQVKTFEDGDKRTALALAGNRLSTLLT